MKILFVHQDTCIYGASKSLLSLIEQVRLDGHDCFVLLPLQGDLCVELGKRDIPFAFCPWRGWTCDEKDPFFKAFIGGIRDLFINLKIASQGITRILDFRPDLVHTNSSKTYFGAILAKKLHVPHVWHFREFLGGPFSVGLRFRFGRRLSEWVISRYADASIFISKTVAAEYRHTTNLRYIIYNGVRSSNEMRIAVSSRNPEDSVLHLCLVGRFDSWKDPMTAFKAVSILKQKGFGQNVKLHIAGEGGDQSDEAKQYVSDHSIENLVNFLGMIHDMESLYTRCSILVMPSKGDAFGRVTAEAMSYGLLVIGAKAGATPELINNGIDGLLFEAENSSELADLIVFAMKHPEKIEIMGANALQKALELFTSERYANEVMNVYHRILFK